MRIQNSIYNKNAVELAPILLGKILCRSFGEKILRLRITETESYFGEEDTACHAHKGKTARTKVMYRRGGFAYIYLCYGVHYLLNIVSGEENHPEAVLIRGGVTDISIENFSKVYNKKSPYNLNGPGKITRALHIDKSLNEEDLTVSEKIWIEDDGFSAEYFTAKRIGIDYATEEYRNKLWRFQIKY